jgi:hypothetical protein
VDDLWRRRGCWYRPRSQSPPSRPDPLESQIKETMLQDFYIWFLRESFVSFLCVVEHTRTFMQ